MERVSEIFEGTTLLSSASWSIRRLRGLLLSSTLSCASAGLPQVEPATVGSVSHATPLDEVVARQAVLFEPNRLPRGLSDRMADSRVVMLGEHHGYREHHAFLLDVIRELRLRGTRWLLLEGYHAESWVADAYVTGALDELSPVTGQHFGYVLDGVRAINHPLAPSERVHVAFVDIDHRAWALPMALSRMVPHLQSRRCVETFLREVGWVCGGGMPECQASFQNAVVAAPESYRSTLQTFRGTLLDGSCFAPEAPAQERETLSEMVEVALESLRIRAIWDRDGEDAAHPAREEVIKALVDRRLRAAEGTVVVNMGGYHLQKTHVMGTPKQWLGEHLASPSHPAGGSVFRVFVQFARAERVDGGKLVWWDLEQSAPEGELLSSLHRHAGQRAAFLPLDDAFFASRKVPVSYMSRVAEHAPGATFDGYVLLPVGHRQARE